MLIQFCWISKKWLRFFCYFPLIRNKLVITLPYTTPSPYISQWYEFKKTVAYKNAYFRNFGRKKWHDLSHELLLCITICYRLKIALCENWLLELKQHTTFFTEREKKSILLPPKNKVEKKQWNLQIVGKLLLFQWHIFTSEVGKWRGFSLAKGGKSSWMQSKA